MDASTALVVSLVVSTLAGWLTSWLLSLYADGVDKGPKAAIVMVGATAIGIPADWVIETAMDHAFATGTVFLGVGLVGAAACATLRYRAPEA